MHCTAGRRPSTSHTLSRTFVSLGRNIAAWIDDQTEQRAVQTDVNSRSLLRFLPMRFTSSLSCNPSGWRDFKSFQV